MCDAAKRCGMEPVDITGIWEAHGAPGRSDEIGAWRADSPRAEFAALSRWLAETDSAGAASPPAIR